MNEIKELFASIGKDDIELNSIDLLGSGLIDSLDIILLSNAISKKYGKNLPAKYLNADNFRSFESIKKMLDEYKNQMKG